MVGTNFLVEKFSVVSPTVTANGYVSAVVFLGQDDYEDAFEIKKEISASGSNSGSDVSADAYYAEPVSWDVEKGITSGVSALEFAPDTICSRGQIVTFLNRTFE